jgi:RNA-directed DNA polymerase
MDLLLDFSPQGRTRPPWIRPSLYFAPLGLLLSGSQRRAAEPRRLQQAPFLQIGFNLQQPAGSRALSECGAIEEGVQRERDRLRAMTGYSQSHKPLPRLIAELNRHLKGWGNYFCFGYPRAAFGWINTYVLQRLYYHVG